MPHVFVYHTLCRPPNRLPSLLPMATLHLNGYAVLVLDDAELDPIQQLAEAAFGEKGFFSQVEARKNAFREQAADLGYAFITVP